MTFKKTRLPHLAIVLVAFTTTACSNGYYGFGNSGYAQQPAAPAYAQQGSMFAAYDNGAPNAVNPTVPTNSNDYNYGFTPPFTNPNYGGSSFIIPPPTPGFLTGTEVSQKIENLRNDLRNLQNNIQMNSAQFRAVRQETEAFSQSYHGVVAAISARLQVGTTPGNPILVQQWNEAQAQLDRVNENIGKLNNVSTMVASNSSVANYMLEAVRAAYGLSGAVDEDHRQLRILEDDTNRTIVMIERLLKELSEDIARQTSYVGAERSNLTALSLAIKNGELYGMSLSNRGIMSNPGGSPRPFDVAAPIQSMPLAGPMGGGEEVLDMPGSSPLVVIRFDQPNVAYERALYGALSKAMERRPDAEFNLVAVSPGRGNPAAQALGSSSARKYAEQVLRSLTDMGLPQNRVHLSTQSSATADVNEVHLYVR